MRLRATPCPRWACDTAIDAMRRNSMDCSLWCQMNCSDRTSSLTYRHGRWEPEGHQRGSYQESSLEFPIDPNNTQLVCRLFLVLVCNKNVILPFIGLVVVQRNLTYQLRVWVPAKSPDALSKTGHCSFPVSSLGCYERECPKYCS